MADKKKAYLYLVITFCAWGSYYVVSKLVIGKVPIFTILFFRYLVSGIVLFLLLRKRNTQRIERQDYKYIFLMGFAAYFLSSALQLTGTKLSNASLASLINSTNPVATMLFASLILKEKITVTKVVCAVLAFIGVYTIIGGIDSSGQILGILLSVFAVISWAFVSVIARKVTQRYDVLQITTYATIVAIASYFPVSAYELATVPDIRIDLTVVLAVLYLGIVCSSLAYVLWNKSLSILEASSCSLFYPLQPMVSVLLGWLFLGETININFVFGAILIISGVLFSIAGKKAPARDTAIKS